jgi:hypothetical protein
MPAPLLLLFGLGGLGVAAAAAASSSSSSSGSPGVLMVSPELLGGLRPVRPSASVGAAMKAAGYEWREGVEKFRDPRLGPYGELADTSPAASLRYLATEPLAKARAAALRGRFEGAGQGGPVVAAMSEASAESLYRAALDLRARFADRKQWPAIAEGLGIPVSKMADAEQAVETALNNATRTYLRVDISSLFRDLRAALGGAIGDAVSAQLSQLGKAIAGAGAVKDAVAWIGDVSSAVSTIMPFLKIIVDKAIAIDGERRARWAEETRGYVDTQIMAWMRKAQERGFPPAWWVPAVFDLETNPGGSGIGASRWVPTADQEGAYKTSRAVFEQGAGLGISTPATLVCRWWALAGMLAADPIVRGALAAFCQQRGAFSSDELVAVVGLVVAQSNGLDPWPFVELLWGYAAGWRALEASYGRNELGTAHIQPPRLLVANGWIMSLADISGAAFALSDALASSSSSKPGPVVGLDVRAIMER